MSASPLQIPGVRKALRGAFATEALDGWTPLSGGLSGARLWRIRVGGIAYLLRVETGRDALRDPRRAYRCQALAAQACLAPRVRYADPDDGVMITDFVENRSLALDYNGTRADLVVELAQAVRALHALEAFPSLTDYLDALDGLVGRAVRGGAVAFEALAGPLEAWDRLRAVCANLAPQPVASHNDLNPRNLLYDGRRVWLIDWEAAFRADRYVDLAALANVFAPDPEREALLLATYFRREARADELARLYLFRQVSHVFHAAAFLAGVSGAARAERLDGPELDELHQGLALGEPLLETPRGRLDYALARLRTATAHIESRAFDQAARTAR
ncbi:aminoglycoside phosphotransferase [Caulobacter segnis]|uniref:Aminoglycoside phosphotransferase n=2 Tax=Caulobacter segnis TaxID=88688 RepID=D5VH11_CAUST|nr:phosphotransferase [Caulobacter segnis]ADG10729.1 aminoglycoside phosphotransferase [Caulobacter segnis ATCC 21756]AVQ02436.1 aminoglycoside phosphotransferase [Caulobacter segnis]